MATAREAIIGLMGGTEQDTRLYQVAGRVADEILARHVRELTDKINAHEPVIEGDRFSHQEDAYYAGLSDAVDILTGDLDGSE